MVQRRRCVGFEPTMESATKEKIAVPTATPEAQKEIPVLAEREKDVQGSVKPTALPNETPVKLSLKLISTKKGEYEFGLARIV